VTKLNKTGIFLTIALKAICHTLCRANVGRGSQEKKSESAPRRKSNNLYSPFYMGYTRKREEEGFMQGFIAGMDWEDLQLYGKKPRRKDTQLTIRLT